MARLEPQSYPGKIVRRIVDIRNETAVREVVIYAADSDREVRRKLKTLGLTCGRSANHLSAS